MERWDPLAMDVTLEEWWGVRDLKEKLAEGEIGGHRELNLD